MHPTAARLAGFHIEVTTLSDSARTAAQAAAALGVEAGQYRRLDAERLSLSPAKADHVREATGFSIGGIPPLGHDIELPTTIDESLRRFEVVRAAAGTPHDVFAVDTEALINAIPGAEVIPVS
jgi:prolyl-tRNA editing enzyme YbaK/EbsC (Cys-tRNA(Pro) deacylase)